MINANTYQYISTNTTTVIGSATARRINLRGIFVNKALTGNVTILSGSTTIGVIASGAAAGTYWRTHDGVEIADLQITTAAADDITVAFTNL